MATIYKKLNNNMSLLGETVAFVILDYGTTSIEGGLTWFDCFVETLSDDLREKNGYKARKKSLKFSTGQKLLFKKCNFTLLDGRCES